MHPFSWQVVKVSEDLTWNYQCFSALRGFDRFFYPDEELAQARADYLNNLEKWNIHYPVDQKNIQE